MLRHAISASIIRLDALWVNQDGVKDQNRQVYIMERIYSRAASVVVWLGPESPLSQAAMELIINRNGPSKRIELLNNEEDSLRGFSDIFRWRWWKRIWIV
ncbi:hypothetical protein N8I77_008270 [Diaporthe amygdali]|uniref:Heterokaryon incompatibility domain-containing protein n=1 Tax=Phomopsis amygdali TaxID=1214568 RepID=A0AAD9SEM4_PHOAM|nr:hypothetical protein N8I77_008270 [Diaporthe amygdali]